jgi:uncharacterized protein YfiM (DUF2279 family)
MRGLALLFTVHLGAAGTGDRWFAADKAKHFLMAAFVETASFSAFRLTGLGKRQSIVAGAAVASAVSVGKELHDLRFGGDPSLKDLTWDGIGIVAATALLGHTER